MNQEMIIENQSLTPIESLLNNMELMGTIIKTILKEDEDYAKIPGCGDKPALMKPGAEKLCVAFRLAPFYRIRKEVIDRRHREYEVTTTLKHIGTGNEIGQGVGMCSTEEVKYAYRKEERTCPMCGSKTIIKGKKEFGGGWVCWKKVDGKQVGCGAKYKEDDPQITSQPTGRIDNPDIADTYNTVLKMGKKRSMVDAVLNCTAASGFFTQDIDEQKEPEHDDSHSPQTETKSKPATPTNPEVPKESEEPLPKQPKPTKKQTEPKDSELNKIKYIISEKMILIDPNMDKVIMKAVYEDILGGVGGDIKGFLGNASEAQRHEILGELVSKSHAHIIKLQKAANGGE